MALKNENGNYLKISQLNGKFISDNTNNNLVIGIKIWENEEIRYNPTVFNAPKESRVIISKDDINTIVDSNISIVDNIITNCYNNLKTGDYSGWIDC